jgi:hypothetical protein
MGQHPSAPIADPHRDFRGALAHPDICDLLERGRQLHETDLLTDREGNLVVWRSASMETLCAAYWHDLNALVGAPLPDPGCRPMADAMHPYRSDKPYDLNRCLGFYHRLREFIERLEAKYQIGGAA